MMNFSIEAIKGRMIAKGAVFPMSARDALRFRNVGHKTLEILRQNGMLLPNSMDGLSTRAVNCLLCMNISSREEARKAIEDYVIHPGIPRNFGKKTYREVAAWSAAKLLS